jgi:DNA-binding transcriptional ArsR family regulator
LNGSRHSFKLHEGIVDSLSIQLHALADPTRRAILTRLALGETTVSELAKPFDMSLPAITKHLKVLQRAGLISQGRDAQRRPCRLEPQALQPVESWLIAHRRSWEQRLDRLGEFLAKTSSTQVEGEHRE